MPPASAQGYGASASGAGVGGGAPAGHWEWQHDNGSWRSFDPPKNAILERAFAANRPEADLPGRHGWRVNFATMQQTNTATTGAQRSVRRVSDAGAMAAVGAAATSFFGALGGMLGGGGAAATPAEAPSPAPVSALSAAVAAGDLPYGGDLQAAMRAGDKAAIRHLMSARDDPAAAGSAPSPAAVPAATGTGSPAAISAAGGGLGAVGGSPPWAGIAIPPGDWDDCFDSAVLTDDELKEDCAVCYCPVFDPAVGVNGPDDVPTKLNKCGHSFHRGCINEALAKCNTKCPVCSTIYGIITGNQPEGTMTIATNGSKLPGFESANGTIVVEYKIPNGTQGPEHPNPGVQYSGATRTCYLPDNAEGRALLAKLETAWQRKLIFTVGTSTTSGRDNMTIW